MFRKWGAFFAVIALGLCLACIAAAPPAPRAVDTPPSEFSSARAMAHVRMIAQKPHPTGSAENAKIRTYLQGRLEGLGLEVRTQTSSLGPRALARLNRWSGQNQAEQEIHNVIGVLPGTDRTKPALLLMAHHDSVWGSPASADATLGLSSILEILRAVRADGPAPRDIIVLFTDAEELGLVGARHFFKEGPLSEKVGAIINFEARGAGGTANMFQTSAGNGNLAALYARVVKHPSTSSLSVFVYNALPNDTDLTPALEKDYVAYNIANIGRPEYYHSPKNDIASLEEGTLQHMGSQGLDLTRALLLAQDFPAPKTDAVFFDLFGFFTVIYAPLWGWIFIALGAVFYVFSLRSVSGGARAIINGGGRGLAFLVLCGVFLYGLNMAAGTGGRAGYYDGLAAIGKLHWLAALGACAVFIFIFGGKTYGPRERFGAVLPLFVLAVIGQLLAPTAAYFLTLAVMLCGLASLMARESNQAPRRIWLFMAGALAVLVAGYMLSLSHLLLLGVGPDMLAVAALPAAVMAAALLPFCSGLGAKARTWLAAACLIAALCLALWIRLDPIAVTVPLYS